MTAGYDVAVIGAGPGGAMAACCCASLGARVVLIDRAAFPREKVCGCCVNQQAMATLAQAGLIEAISHLPQHSLSAVELRAQGRRATLRLIGGVAMGRDLLDNALVRAAVARGVTFWPTTRAAVYPQGKLVLHHKDGHQRVITAGCVVAADGLQGRCLETHPGFCVRVARNSRIGLGAILPQEAALPKGKVVMACGREGYVGMVRLGDGRLNVAAALDPHRMQQIGRVTHQPAWRMVGRVLEQAGVLPPDGLKQARWVGTPHLSRQRRPLYLPRVLLIGDAAGYVEPFTGQGIAWALAGGAAVAPLAVAAGASWDDSIGQQWRTVYRQQVQRGQRGCQILAAILRRPGLTGVMVGMLDAWPAAAQQAVDWLAGAGAPRPVGAGGCSLSAQPRGKCAG